ncbi:putative UbiE/COQ5 family methyltransferase [Rhexocercosporidium sp. MPI-PUGE-AT-0058]|nr:putative UbiE/COQ5 family methyltransferase [Rhexocercosporidium sp. MPI-PUGE-AT-0058]
MSTPTPTAKAVHAHYSSLALEDPSKNTQHALKVASSFGYTPEDLASVPEGSNLGVSCGNPFAIAGIKPGETVIDLGCGGGFDVFQAAHKVGPTGLAIGVDSSEDMLALSRKNAANSKIENVKFVFADITDIPLEDGSADCVISNCVINLLEERRKKVCFGECFRLLREGGRVAVSDILAKKVFTEELKRDIGLYVGCVSGASLVGDYEAWLREVGFGDILIVDKKSDLNIYKERSSSNESGATESKSLESSCCAPATSCCRPEASGDSKVDSENTMAKRVADIDFNEWVSSYSIYAVKPKKQ